MYLAPGICPATFETIAGVRMPSSVQPMISVGAVIRARSALRSKAGFDDILRIAAIASGSLPSQRRRKRSKRARSRARMLSGYEAARLACSTARTPPRSVSSMRLRAAAGSALAHVAGLADDAGDTPGVAAGERERDGGAHRAPGQVHRPADPESTEQRAQIIDDTV